MAEPMRNPEPLPNQQPENSEPFLAVDPQAEIRVLDTERELPEEASPARRSGNVVEWRKTAGQKLEEAKDSASEIVEKAATRASAVYAEAGENLSRAYTEGRERSARMIRQARRRAEFYAYRYPLQVIAAVAGVSFAVGVLLRVWRSNRHE